ncbi:hypothetical protein, partial [Melissococcus plutonius]
HPRLPSCLTATSSSYQLSCYLSTTFFVVFLTFFAGFSFLCDGYSHHFVVSAVTLVVPCDK